ncbi:MAG: hypothetical protein AB7U71_02625 [Comamonas sp.]
MFALSTAPSDMDSATKQKAESRFSKELLKSYRREDELRQAYELFIDASE